MRKNLSVFQLHPLLRMAVCLALGICMGYECGGALSTTTWLAATGACVAAALALGRLPYAQGVAVMLSATALGGFLVTRQCEALDVKLPARQVTYQAVVASRPTERGKVARLDLWLVGDDELPRKVKAALMRDSMHRDPLSLKVGDGIVATSAMQPPTDYFDSNFSYPLYLRCHGFTATTLVMPDGWKPSVVDLSPLSLTDRTIIAAMAFRQRVATDYLERLGDDDEMAVAMAMTLGDKSRLTRELREVYSVSGASHVLALSGLHLGIIYVLLSLMVRSRRLGVARQLLIVTGIWAYAVLTGLSPSVVRAAVMISIYAAVTLLRRERLSLNALALTAIVMLVANPLCLYDVGFQMSFMAVAAILACYRRMYGWVDAEWLFSHRVAAWAWTMVVVSVCAQMGVAPLTAYYFGRFSVYFLLTNFIVIPMATFIIYATVALVVCSLWTPAMHLVGAVLAVAVRWQNILVQWVSDLPGSSVGPLHVDRLQLCLTYVLVAALAIVADKVVRHLVAMRKLLP